MPPNFKGGKNYKKKAKQDDIDPSILMIERQADQQIARVIRALGNRNMQCYCNDNTVRICHIRGKMRNRVYVEVGDMVLVSLREYEGDTKETSELRGDILAKYPSECLSKLKKEDGINQRLFMSLETMNGVAIGEIGQGKNTIEDTEEGFEFDRDAAADATSEGESSDIDDDDIDAI